MRPLRPWVLLGIPLAAEIARFSAGAQNLTLGTALAILLSSSALAGLLWRSGRCGSGAVPDAAPHPASPAAVAHQELEALRREHTHLRWVADWQGRLLQQTGAAAASRRTSRHHRAPERAAPSDAARQ